MTPRPDDDRDLARAWREASAEEPPAALDDAIRAAARKEVSARPHAISDRRAWWPLAAAATLGAVIVGILQVAPVDDEGAPTAPPAASLKVPSATAPPRAAQSTANAPAPPMARPDPAPTAPPAPATPAAAPKADVGAPSPPAARQAPAARADRAATERAGVTPTSRLRTEPSPSAEVMKPGAGSARETPGGPVPAPPVTPSTRPVPPAEPRPPSPAVAASASPPLLAEPPIRASPQAFPAARRTPSVDTQKDETLPAQEGPAAGAPAPSAARGIAPRAAAAASFEDGVQAVERLLREGRRVEAQRELARLRERYPGRDDALPPELKALIEPR